MNIKRAFFAAVATLMVPGFAMAQTTITFDTQLDLLPDGPYTQTVTATLTCNTGNPLSQSFEIGPTTSDKVVFVVDNFNLEEFISCEITASTASGFIALGGVANADVPTDIGDLLALPGSCLYEANPTPPDSVDLVIGENRCTFVMAPAPFTWEIEKVWEFDSEDVDVADSARFDWTCVNVVQPTLNNAVTTTFGSFTVNGDATYEIGGLGFHPNPWAGTLGGTTTCSATETVTDSAVESDQGCASGTTFTLTDREGSCTVTNSVFFEGIPTLSQYGLAVMALLMLGVGFIGFRRFV